jgi:hypothetical protein
MRRRSLTGPGRGRPRRRHNQDRQRGGHRCGALGGDLLVRGGRAAGTWVHVLPPSPTLLLFAARPVIDGEMASAIGDQQIRRRTLTVYTELRRLTAPLGLTGRNTIWRFLTDRTGRVRWHGCGGWEPAAATGRPNGSMPGTGSRSTRQTPRAVPVPNVRPWSARDSRGHAGVPAAGDGDTAPA